MPATHDYFSRECFGHSYTFTPIDGGILGVAIGWGPLPCPGDDFELIKAGDYLLLKNGERPTRYRVTEISYYDDPPDMWKAKLMFAPRHGFSSAKRAVTES